MVVREFVLGESADDVLRVQLRRKVETRRIGALGDERPGAIASVTPDELLRTMASNDARKLASASFVTFVTCTISHAPDVSPAFVNVQ